MIAEGRAKKKDLLNLITTEGGKKSKNGVALAKSIAKAFDLRYLRQQSKACIYLRETSFRLCVCSVGPVTTDRISKSKKIETIQSRLATFASWQNASFPGTVLPQNFLERK